MQTPFRFVRSLVMAAFFVGACGESTGGGTAGRGGADAGGGAGGAGTGGKGSGGAGTAGSGGAGVAGNGGGGGATGGTTGSAGKSGGPDARDGGATAGDTTGGGGDGQLTPARGLSAGCGKAAPAGDSSANFLKHDIDVTGVDPAFIAAHPANVAGYTWSKRNYFLRLPAGYDMQKGYAVHFGGGGCGNTNGMSGENGAFAVPGTAATGAIQVGLSYVYDNGACFKDEYVNTPELPFFDAVMKELDANYCFDKAKVFIAGYSSGAWEAYTLAFARGGVIRGIATAAGGLRKDRPTPSRIPFAAILLTGAGDTSNPITGATGSALARDLVLQTNGCVGTATVDWPAMPSCKQYTGCPAAYPVIWCTPDGGHTDGGGGYRAVISNFWDAVPPAP
jgi:hypothetical protein